MRLPRLHLSAVVVLLGVAPMSDLALAQTARSGGGANPELLLQVQELTTERTSLQAENARVTKELQAAQKERDALKTGRKALDTRVQTTTAQLAQTTAQRDSTEQELKRTKDQMRELIDKFRETIQTMRTIESDRTLATQTLAARDRELKVCIDRNLAMYKVADEALERLDKESVWSRISEKEPFTRIKRVELENLIDDYRSRAQEQRVTPERLKAEAATVPSAPPPATPARAAPPAPQPPNPQ